LEGEEIQEFWGQLWFVPNATSRARVREVRDESLVWIRRDLWLAKSFKPTDCFPVGEGDKWDEPLSKLSFAEDIWGKGERESFVAVVKASMAGRGRGSGPHPRGSEENWENWGEAAGISTRSILRRPSTTNLLRRSDSSLIKVQYTLTHPLNRVSIVSLRVLVLGVEAI
jgi:hypothetical protein